MENRGVGLFLAGGEGGGVVFEVGLIGCGGMMAGRGASGPDSSLAGGKSAGV